MNNKMNRKFLIAILAIGLFSTVPMLAQENVKSKMEHQKIENVSYTCPMHSDIKSNKPGDCPKCGMELEILDTKKIAIKHCDMPKKGSCCPEKLDVSTTKTNKKSGCTRTIEEINNNKS